MPRFFLSASLLLAALLGVPGIAAEAQSLGGFSQTLGRKFGVAVKASLLESDPEYRERVRREFTSLTPEDDMKMDALQPREGVFDFARADAAAEFARRNGMQVRGHTLVWHRQIPAWVKPETRSPDELRKILKTHVQTAVRHYREKFPSQPRVWDVVNEALGDEGGLRDTPWARIGATREEYIELAFRWAHEADPDAKLFYNDYGTEGKSRKTDEQYALLASLKRKGVPIHGVGFQLHLEENPTHPLLTWRKSLVNDSLYGGVFRVNMDRLARLGLEIHVTEADVSLPTNTPPSPELLELQAKVYNLTLNSCLSQPACTSYTVWGLSDRESWVPQENPGRGDALLLDKGRKPKPAYEKILISLRTLAAQMNARKPKGLTEPSTKPVDNTVRPGS